MGKNDRIALRGKLRGSWLSLWLFLVLYATVTGSASAQETPGACAFAVGRVVSIQGNVDVRRAGTGNWSRISRLDTLVCAGDEIRTLPLSRAALFMQPETLVRVDQNTTITVSQTTTEIVVEFFQDEIARAARDAQSCGAGYFITRFPKRFKVSTPHLNAAVEGTEFQVALNCDSTELTVLEGEVRSETVAAREERVVTGGQMLVASATSPGVLTTQIKPTDAVQWVLYYPPLSDTTGKPGIPTSEQCRGMSAPADQTCLTQRAEALLRLGLSEEALQDVKQALALNPANGDANALRAIIEIAKNEKAAALQSAEAATGAAPGSYRAWLALSYAQQASFDLEQALESAKKAQALEPTSSLLNARVAELLLSLGRTREAEAAARAAVHSNPNESRAHTILGFVHLAQIDTKAARTDFNTAIEQDSFNPLPRLGLGLAIIRDGKVVEGREQLEIAVALDPTNSLFRSYVGKAYYEENAEQRNNLAGAQFDFAKQLDPKDPTAPFYDAILKQSQNRPVEALRELDTSIETNDNRAVYRSKLLLDDDAAARNASVAAIYGNLGFEKLAILESTKALAVNAGNHSAHRQLAAAYANLPRHDIARVSEALQAQIRQPVSVSPVDPLLATDNLLILREIGPTQLGANEFNLLFNREQLQFSVDAILGNRDTSGYQAVLSGLENRLSFAASALRYETDGFIENDAAEKRVYDIFVHGQVSDTSSVQLDIKRSDSEVGQTFSSFDPQFADPTTILEESDSARLSGHHVINPGADWVWSAAYEDRQRDVSTFPDGFVFLRTDVNTISVEVQNLYRLGQLQVVSGLGYTEEEDEFEEPPSSIVTRATNLYAYGQWGPEQYDLSIQVGLAADWFEQTNSLFPNATERERLSPKVGLVWSPRGGTTLRAAAFSSVRRPFIRSQTVEPTQVAGFNQFFTGFEQVFGDRDGIISERAGIALDQALPGAASTGVEFARRRLTVPSIILDDDFKWDETTAYAYLYKPLLLGTRFQWQGALSLDGEYEEIERPQDFTGAEGIIELRTLRAPVAIRFFSANGFSVRLATTYVEQEGTFSLDVGEPVFPKEDSAWITDLAVEYRLPDRLGSIALGANNLTDNFIDLLETDPFNPRVATRRFVFAKIRLNL
jgi:tetratricopeptide (TPR) repeat protein